MYQKTPPALDELRWIVDHLEDPVTDIVRRDALFTQLGLTEGDVQPRLKWSISSARIPS